MKLITDIRWSLLEISYLLIIFIIGFLVTYMILPYIIRFLKNKGYIGIDIHKKAHPQVAESGGIVMIIGISIESILLMIFFPILINIVLIFILTVILAGFIGFIDDMVKLRSIYKIGLTIFTGTIIFFANYFKFIEIASPVIPFLGATRLTILYPFLVPIIVAVFANTVNMLEGYNGEGSGTCLIAVFFILICAILWNSLEALILSIITIAVIIPFFLFNKFPAKIFPGDIGTLSIGAMIACIALMGHIEVAVFCALLIHIFNSFYVISSVRGFLESSKIIESKHDIILLDNDLIKASDQKNAALTLPRLILVRGPLTESELVKNIYIISIICGFFSIISIMFMQWTVGNYSIIIPFVFIIIFTIPTIILLYKYPRVRGTIILMCTLLLLSILFLTMIDLFIMPLKYPNIDLLVFSIPVNILFSLLLYTPMLLFWYYITLRYFWWQINKMKEIR